MKGVGESGQQSSFKTTNATLATLLTLKVNVFLFLGFLCWISVVQSCGGCSGTTGMKTAVKCVHQTSTRLHRAFIERVDRFSAGSAACNKPVAAEGEHGLPVSSSVPGGILLSLRKMRN